VAVNLSCRQFEDEGLAAMVETTLRETGLDPQTWTQIAGTAMQGVEFSVKTLHELRRMGVRVSIDSWHGLLVSEYKRYVER
jgi:EAL domain-containing protein (putative c-di-GMP-specific phosphodiesterase class I)